MERCQKLGAHYAISTRTTPGDADAMNRRTHRAETCQVWRDAIGHDLHADFSCDTYVIARHQCTSR